MTGTIRFITAKPNLIDFGGSFGAGYRETQNGGVGSQVDAMVNLPLVTDRFAIRLAGFTWITRASSATSSKRMPMRPR